MLASVVVSTSTPFQPYKRAAATLMLTLALLRLFYRVAIALELVSCLTPGLQI
jgi:hypothetical protein